MVTVSGGRSRSLLFWRQNKNNSNVYETSFGGDALCLKENYLAVFRTIENALKANTATSFVKLWQDAVKAEEEKVFAKVKSGAKCGDDSANSVAAKFRGNVAEIFAEKVFEEGQGYVKPGTYSPVDPHKERGVDATAVSSISGLDVGIQVKNYSCEAVPIQVFRTAGDESDRYVHTIAPERFSLFLTHPNQYIVSFTDVEEIVRKDYERRVGFLGPKWIDGLGLQGKRGEKCGRWIFFMEIADEISKVV